MKNNLEHNNMAQLSDSIEELKQLNALLGFMQTAFAEGPEAISEGEAADALYHIYINQCELLIRMQEILKGGAAA